MKVEANSAAADKPDSIVDKILDGLVSQVRSGEQRQHSSDYLRTLIRDASSSHLLEAIIVTCSEQMFSTLWECYFAGQLHKMAFHPVCNFLVARCIERLDSNHFKKLLLDLEPTWPKLVKSCRSGILISVVHRASILNEGESNVASVSSCEIFCLFADFLARQFMKSSAMITRAPQR